MSVPWGVWFEPTQPVRRLVELARLGESLGAEMCFVADEGTERDVYVALTAIVEATGLTVAPAITNPFSRHPVATAAAIATLAELAPGRVMHGLRRGRQPGPSAARDGPRAPLHRAAGDVRGQPAPAGGRDGRGGIPAVVPPR